MEDKDFKNLEKQEPGELAWDYFLDEYEDKKSFAEKDYLTQQRRERELGDKMTPFFRGLNQHFTERSS